MPQGKRSIWVRSVGFAFTGKGLLILVQKTDMTESTGRAASLCPDVGCSDVHLLRYGQGIINIDAQIAHRALNLRVSKKKLDRA